MNKFKKLGFINYSGYKGRLTVLRGLLSVVLHDQWRCTLSARRYLVGDVQRCHGQ